MSWLEQVWSRVVPEQGVSLSGGPLVVVLVAAPVAVSVEPAWRVDRKSVV